METITVKIQGMTCGGCANSVKRVLFAIAGVQSVEVSLDAGEARVQYDPAKADVAEFKQAITDAGYTAV
jgi:copper chaperone